MTCRFTPTPSASGSQRRTVLVYGRSGDRPAPGLTVDSVGLTAAYARTTARATSIDLIAGEIGSWSPGGFIEIDSHLMPGVYQLDLPNEALTAGASRAMVVIQAASARFDPVDIDLVAFDQQDSYSLGMAALTREARMSCLSGAFPKLAAFERERSEETTPEPVANGGRWTASPGIDVLRTTG